MKALSNKQWSRIEKILAIAQQIADKVNRTDLQVAQLEALAKEARETKKSQTHRLKDVTVVAWDNEYRKLHYEVTQYNKEMGVNKL